MTDATALPTISIIICTHNRREILMRTLQSLRKMDAPGDATAEIIVIANACTDDTEAASNEAAATMPYTMRCVVEPVPGHSNARNRGVRESQAPLIAMLDDDVWVDKRWLIELLDLYKKYPADFSGAKVPLWWDAVQRPDWFTADYEWILSGCDAGDEVFEMTSTAGAIGANFSFKRKVFDTVGQFRVDVGRIGKALLGGDESEFLQRALAGGFRGFYNPKSIVKHWVAPHRISEEYMIGIMEGYTLSRIFMKPTFGPITASRALLGHAWLYAKNQVLLTATLLRGNSAGALPYRIKRAAGKGGFIGACRRLMGRKAQ